MRPLGLIFKYSGAFCSFLPKSRYTDSYVNPSSSRTMATFLRIGLGFRCPRAGRGRAKRNVPAVGSALVGVQGELLSVRHGLLVVVVVVWGVSEGR